MARSTEQIYQHHMDALTNGDFPAFIADYADDAVLMTMEGAHVGKDAIQTYFVNALSAMPNSKISPTGHKVHGRFRPPQLDRRVRRGDRPSRGRHLCYPR